MMGNELKPCPFCGRKPELRVIDGKRTVLRCTDSQCYLFWNPPTSFHNGDTDAHAALRLTTWWNMRTEDVGR